MNKRIVSGLLFGVVLLLSGCTLPLGGGAVSLGSMTGGVIRSDDRGQTYKPVVKIDDKTNIAGVETVTLAINRNDTKNIFLGSLANGVYITNDGGESWVKSNVPISKNYAIVVHPNDSNIAYVTGVYNGRGKIAKTMDRGVTWKEIYTEPSDGTVILSLAISPNAPDTVYAGTSTGVIIATTDGGATWGNKTQQTKPIRALSTDVADGNVVYAMTFQDSLLLSRDGGKTFVDMKAEWAKRQEERVRNCKSNENCSASRIDFGMVYSYALDVSAQGTGYIGTDKGVFRFSGYGNVWEEVNIIASSKAFPISAIAVNPRNAKEIYYASAQAIYRTLDGGSNWFAFQLDADKASVSTIAIPGDDSGVVYVGLRQGGK